MEDLKIREVSVVVTPADIPPTPPVDDNDIPPEEPIEMPAGSAFRRSEPQRDDLSQKTREAIEEGNRLSSMRMGEQNRVKQDQASKEAVLKKMEQEQLNSSLSHPA